MKRAYYILTITTLMVMISCDPVHDIRLENKTDKKIEVIYSPTLNQQKLEGHKSTKVLIAGRKMDMVTLNPNETIRIGHVSANYIPKPSDIHLDYLEIRLGADTLKLTGHNSIFSTIQKVEKLNWRLIIRKE